MFDRLFEVVLMFEVYLKAFGSFWMNWMCLRSWMRRLFEERLMT